MSENNANTVELDGHTVAAERLDEFHNGSDGRRVSDDQWDTTRDRQPATVDELKALGFAYVGTSPSSAAKITEGV